MHETASIKYGRIRSLTDEQLEEIIVLWMTEPTGLSIREQCRLQNLASLALAEMRARNGEGSRRRRKG